MSPPARAMFTHLAKGLGLAAVATACGSQPGAAAVGGLNSTAGAVACTVSADAQPACPSPAPSYANQVEAIITNNCQVCHASGGIGAAATPGGGGDAGHGGSPQNATFEAMDANHRPVNFDPSTAHDWSVIANIKADRTKMMQMLFLCTMPPPTASTLTNTDRATLAEWLACGAPDN